MSSTSSAREVRLPPLSPHMSDARIQRWFVSEGQRVAPGDILVEIATASATLEVEAENAGRIERILVPAGTAGVKVNTPIALLVEREEPTLPAQASSVPLSPGAGDATTRPSEPAGAEAALVHLSYREALRDALAEEMRRDDRVVLFGTDLAQNRGAQKVTQGLLDEFGSNRVVNVPPVEDAFLNLAVGAAMAGLRPVVELSSWGRALEGLEAALTTACETQYLTGGAVRVPLVLRGPNGWAPGQSGHDARCVAARLAEIPGLKVVAPATPRAAKALLKAAIRDGGPVAVLEHELLYAVKGEVAASEDEVAAIGEARVAIEGSDITLVAFGREVTTALAAADELNRRQYSVEVIDLMSLRPLDLRTLSASLQKTGRLVTVEAGWPSHGIGAEIIAAMTEVAFGALKAPPRRVAGAALPMPYAEPLQAAARPNVDRLIDTALAALASAR